MCQFFGSGCAAVVERLVLPPEADEGIPVDPEEAATYAANHPGLQEVRIVQSVAQPNTTTPAPNLFLTQPLTFAHAAGVAVVGEDLVQAGVGFQPPYATEGRLEALEFAAGNYGLLESAYEYAKDDVAPQVTMTGPTTSRCRQSSESPRDTT